MSITTGVGLYSGIDTASLINQLLAIDARPKTLAQQRIVQLQTQQAAFLEINSALSALKTASDKFVSSKVFDSNKASSSNDKVLAASAGKNAAAGSYTFLVDRLVTTQQALSRGFADRDAASVGATRFTFEVGGGGVTTETRLSELNGGLGVERGKIKITDRSGATSTVDLSRAVTVEDVIQAINGAGTIQVDARVDGDRLVLDDTSGGTSNLIVEDVFGSTTASSLGIAGSVAANALTGSDVRYISGATALSLLNDGNGVHIVDGSTDLKLTAKNGTVLNIDLGKQTTTTQVDGEDVTTVTQARATTVQDVIDIINKQATAAGLAITAGINGDGSGFVINDATGGGGNLKIESVNARRTASDLGILADTASTSVVGARLLSGINSVLVSSLNGGSGLSAGDLTFTDRNGASHAFTLSAASLSGSLSDVVSEINSELAANGVGISATINRAGNGIALTDASGGNGAIIVSGGAASELGIESAGTSSNSLDGANLQKKWISRSTRLADLNVGQGIGTGDIRITDASGGTTTMNIGSSLTTIGDLISFLNSRPGISVTADINDSGDGIVIRDTSGGAGTLKIEDVTGTAAKGLNIKGEFKDEGSGIAADGSYEREVTFDPTDTLDKVVDAINAAGAGVTATVINDGSGASPYRISITAKNSGKSGRAIIDTGGLDLGLSTLSRGDDAVAFFGSSDPAKGVLLTSSTNSLDNVVRGVSIDLEGTSEDPVNVVVSRDEGAIETAVQDMVDAFNNVIDVMSKHSSYDQDTKRRGALLGDSTAGNVRTALLSVTQSNPIGVDGSFQYLFQVGIKIGSGSKLEFDADRFRSAMASDFENVKNLLSASKLAKKDPIELAPGITVANTTESYDQLGFAGQFKRLVDSMTNSVDGILTQRDKTLDTKIELQQKQITRIDGQLARKRASLEKQFTAMEQALASLSSQQAALQSLQSLG